MRRRLARFGDRLAGGLHRLLDNQVVFWLGAVWGVASVHVERSRFRWVPLALLVGVVVVMVGLGALRWWMRRRWQAVLTEAPAEGGGPR